MQLEALEPRQLLTVMVERIGLAEDTGVSATDRITSRPELVGHVVSYMPTGNVRMEFDHQGDGIVDGSAPVAADKTFRYDPRQFDSQLVGYQGPVNIRYRPLRLNNAGQVEYTGWWQSFAFTLEGPPPANYQIRDLQLVFDTGSSATDGRTSDPTIQGRVVDVRPGSSSPQQVVVQLDHNGDGSPEATLNTGSGDSFTYAPRGLAVGPVSLSARALQWDEGLGTYLQGPWAALSFVLEPPPAGEVTDLRLVDNLDTVGGATIGGMLLTGRLSGTSDQVASQQVEIDLDGNGLTDLSAVTDDAGNFTRHLTPSGPGELTVRVRGTRYDAGLDALSTGVWTAATFRVDPLATPSFADWEVVGGVADQQGRIVTGAAVVTGSLAGVLQGTAARVEWDHDGDGQADGTSSLDVDGRFVYRLPGAQPGEIALRARGAAWDHRLLSSQAGAWQSLTFTLTAPPELPSQTPRLTLRHDTGTSAADGVTSDPTVVGTLSDGTLSAGTSGDGTSGAWVTLELDFDLDGQFDDTLTADARGQFQFTPPAEPGHNTIQVRARRWDAARRQGSLGPWSQLSFTYELPELEPPMIEFFSLASDSGPSQVDGITANSLLVGRLAAASSVDSVVAVAGLGGRAGTWIELDVDGDGVADEQVVADERGEFAFQPGPLAPGTHTVSARAIQWDLARQTEVAGPWIAAGFTLQPQASAPAIITQLELASPPDGGTDSGTVGSVVRDAAVRGRIVNENALHGVTIELDVNRDGTAVQTTTTDRLGRFELSPAGLSDGSVELRFRTRELDPASGELMFGQWNVLSFEFERSAPQTVELASLAAAEEAYWASVLAADQAHAAAMEAAGGRLVAELGSLAEPSSMAEISYVPWAWPAAPLTESREPLLGTGSSLAESLGAEDRFHGRPDYDWSSDLDYSQDLAVAAARREAALRELDQQYLADLAQAADEHRQSAQAAEQAFLIQVRSAQAERQRTLADATPPLDAQVIGQQRQQQVQDAAGQVATAERQHAQDYENALRASQQVENTEIAAARRAYDDSNRAAGERFFYQMANPFLSAEEQEAARHEYISTLAENEVILATAIATANRKQRELAAAELRHMNVRNAGAQRDYEQAVAQADSLLAQRQAELNQWQGVTEQQAEHSMRQAMAVAQWERQLALHAAQQQHVVAVAEAITRREQGRAAVERQYQEDAANARQEAVDALHQFEDGNWSEYQRSLADNHAQFVISQGTAAEAYMQALSNANLQQVVAVAATKRAQADRNVDAELERDLAWFAELHAFSLDELAADRERLGQQVELWRQRQGAFAVAEHALQLRLAERRYDADLRHAHDEGERTIAIGQLTADELWHYDAVQHERRMAVIEHTRQIAARDSEHTYLLAGIAARQAQDEDQAAATRYYEQGYVDAERARQQRVTDARQRFEQAAAEADRQYRHTTAQAAGVTDVMVAEVESTWRIALAEADASLVFETTVAGGERLVADERAAADSELDAAIGDTLVRRVEEVAEAQTAWVHESNQANLEFARMAAEAYQQQVETTVAAADALAADAGAGQLTYDLLTAGRTADRDRLVVGAGHELEVELAESREALARAFSSAARNYHREEAHARHQRERSLQDALLQARLGQLAPGEYETLVQAAHQTYADHLDSAGYVRRRAEAAAEEERANQEAIAHLQWTVSVGEVLVNWTDGLGSASETLAATLEQASIAFAQAQAQAGLDFATETAAAEYLRTVTAAVAQAERQNLLAAADARLDVALVEQVATAEMRDTQTRSTAAVASLEHYAAHYLASATENPTALAEYRRAAAQAELAWAESVSDARSAYLQTRFETTVAYAQATNDADLLHALATTTANVILADGRATADRIRTVDYSRAVGQRAVEHSRAMLERGREHTGALSEFRTANQQARQDYELRLAEARTEWVARLARAEAERYVSLQSSDAQSRFAAAKAEADAAYLATAQAARVVLAAELGDAEIARVSRVGDAEVARAQAFGDAGQVFAEAAGESTTIFTALATGHEEQWVQATSLADAERVKNLAAAEAGWVAGSSAAVTTWQTALGLAHEDFAAGQAVAVATYHVAQSAAAAERLSGSEPGGQLLGLESPAKDAEAYAQWIAYLSDDYASFARTTASADAAQRVQLAQAAADLDLARVANEGRLIGQQADLDFTRDHNRIALWGDYEQVLIHHENLLRELTAAADGALDVRRAEAARQLALERAHAARQRDVGLALGEAGALDQFDTAVVVAEARRDAALAHAEADWTRQIVQAQSQFTADHASAMHALRTGLATLDQRYQVDLAGAFRSQQTSDAAAEADYAIAEFEAIGQLRVRLAAAISSWQSAELAAEADARDRLDAELGTPASQFSAEMAAARSAWWQQQALPFESWAHAVHGVQMTYQGTVAEAYEQHAASVASAGAAWLSDAADAVLSVRLDAAGAELQNQAAYNAADTQYLLALAAAREQLQVGLAEVRQQYAGASDSAEFKQATQAVHDQFEAARHEAWLDYAASAVGSEDQRRVNGATGELNLLESLAAGDEQFWEALGSAGNAYQEAEATAHAARQHALADEHSAWQSQAADLLFAELEQRALIEDSPWLRFAASAWDAERQREAAVAAAGFTFSGDVFDTQRHQQQSQRNAEHALLAGTLAAEADAASDQAAARLEQALEDADAHAANPQASLPALAPPQLPQQPAGYQKTIEDVAELQTATQGAELTESPLWSGFAGPHEPRRWNDPLLRSGLVQTGRPADEARESRHGAHLVVDTSHNTPWVDGSERIAGGVDVVALSISQLLALAQVPLLTEVTDPAELPATARKQLRLAQLVLRGAPDPGQFHKLDDWLDAEQAYRQQLGRDVMQHSTDAQRALWFALRQEAAADYFDQLRPDHGTIGAPVNPWEFARQIDDAHFRSLDFWERRQTLRHWDETTNQFWMGAYTKDHTLEGTVGEIGMSLSGLDLPMDVRDLHYQASHWEWTWAHAGKTALYGVSLLPVIGVLKNLKHVEHIKHADPVVSAARHAQPAAGLEAAAEVGSGVARQADDSRLLLQTGGEACFVAGTLVMVAPDADEAAVEDAGQATAPAWHHWTSLAMIAAGSGLLARLGLQLARPHGRNLDERHRAPRNHHSVKPAVR